MSTTTYMLSLTDDEKELLDTIKGHDSLTKAVLEMVSIGNNEILQLRTADDAEDAVVEKSQEAQLQVLQRWIEKRAAHEEAAVRASKDYRPHGKKK